LSGSLPLYKICFSEVIDKGGGQGGGQRMPLGIAALYVSQTLALKHRKWRLLLACNCVLALCADLEIGGPPDWSIGLPSALQMLQDPWKQSQE
jgi:hypothetical protein